MHKPAEGIAEADLLAYVDEQLDLARRIEVEDHLSRNPPLAARVMADLRLRDALRLAMPAPAGPAPSRSMDACRRLERGLLRDGLLAPLRRAAAVALLLGAGWLAHAQLGGFGIAESVASIPPPAFVEEAVAAHRTALVRSGMRSQHGIADYDPDEIRSVTAIVMPELPRGWQILDVQVFPSRHGPSVEVAADGGADLGRLSLYAVRPGGFDVLRPATTRNGEEAIAFWQIGEVAYALVGRGGEVLLDRTAEALSRSLY